MKKILSMLLLMPALALAQYGGNLQAYQVRTASYGATQWSLLSLPDDYTSTSQTYPLIIFLHGLGEIGSTAQNLTRLINQGLPKVISSGTKIQAVHPLTGQLVKFIVLAPQHHAWTTSAESIEYMVNDLPKKFRIDTNNIIITGLSAGGQGVIQAVTYKEALTKKFSCILPMSPSAPDDKVLKNFTFFSSGYPAAWFFSGDKDPGNYTANARRYNDSINKYNKGGSTLTLYNGAHDSWAMIYDTSYRVDRRNIYEWMLMHPKGGNPPVVEPPPIKYIKIFCDPKNVRKVIILNWDDTWEEVDSTSYTSGSGTIQMF